MEHLCIKNETQVKHEYVGIETVKLTVLDNRRQTVHEWERT